MLKHFFFFFWRQTRIVGVFHMRNTWYGNETICFFSVIIIGAHQCVCLRSDRQQLSFPNHRCAWKRMFEAIFTQRNTSGYYTLRCDKEIPIRSPEFSARSQCRFVSKLEGEQMSSQDSSRVCDEEEAFYTHCRAAYLAVFRSSLTNIASKHQLCRGEI